MTIAKDVLRETVANAMMGVGPIAKWRINRPRVGADAITPESLDRYAFQMLRGIEDVVGSVAGRDIVEFGPGDTLGAGLACLAGGARTYTALDRFEPDYSSANAKTWYRAIHEAWASFHADRFWPSELDPSSFPAAYPSRVKHIGGGVEAGQVDAKYDVVTSWQVGEHVNDVGAFCNLTAALLRPDGIAIHRVDFGPHDCWREYDDPRLFLRFPAPLWRAMGSNRGYPNRVRHDGFMRAWEAAGLEVECAAVGYFDEHAPAAPGNVRDVVYICRWI